MNKDALAQKISVWLLRFQERFALFMKRRTAGYPTQTLKILFFIMCSLQVVMSGWTIIDAFTGTRRVVTVSHIKARSLLKTREHPGNILPALSSANLKRYQNFIDSLKKNNLRLYDSVIRLRPGIRDSLLEIEKIYSLQQ